MNLVQDSCLRRLVMAAPAAALLAVVAASVTAASPAAGEPPVVAGGIDAGRPLSDRIASYSIQVTLQPEDHALRGREVLTWRNATLKPASELRFHLYLNAFKNSRTTFMKESGGVSRGYRFREGEWGYIDVLGMRLGDGEDLLAQATFVQPDDGNPEDETVLRVPLPRPVAPGESLEVGIEFAARLPRVFARTGYKNDFHLVAQWFPKIGVLQESGWNCHQFHEHSEFFSDFGTYDVRITVPSDYVVGATGALASDPAINGDGTTTYRYVQDDVHDFAWTADPDFIKVTRRFAYEQQRDPVEEERMARVLGIPPASDRLKLSDVDVTLLIHPEHVSQIERHFAAVFTALRCFGYWYGSYPYRTLTVVDPPYLGRGAGGMEYPTLITAGTGYVAPSSRLSPEGVTVHEFGHQYWYGMVATNEAEEAFLDEGFTTYSTGRVLELAYGPNRDAIEIAPGLPYLAVPLMEIPRGPDPLSDRPAPSGLSGRLADLLLLRPFGPSDDIALNTLRDLPFLNAVTDAPIDWTTAQRKRYLRAPKADELARRSWEYIDTESYGLNSYARTALMLETLEGFLGQDLMLKVMRTYFERYRFRHPTADDFIATANEVSGSSLDDFFRQAISGSDLMDYAVTALSSDEPDPAHGLFGPAANRRRVAKDEARAQSGSEAEAAHPGGARENEVVVRRLGEFVWPQVIELRHQGDGASRSIWDGRYRWTRIRGEAERLESACVDPEGTMALDVNRGNNCRARDAHWLPGVKWWSRILQWMQHVAYFYSGVS